MTNRIRVGAATVTSITPMPAVEMYLLAVALLDIGQPGSYLWHAGTWWRAAR